MDNKMIRKANHLIEASYKLSAIEQKIIAILASSIKADDKEFQSYPVKIKDFQNSTGVSSNDYDRLEKVFLGLKEKNLKIISLDENGKKVTLNASWLSSSEYTEGSGVIKLCFDPKLKPLFLQLKACFTNYRLKNVIQLKSQFSIRIYELLKQYEKLGQRLFNLSELRTILGIDSDQYKLYADFKRKVIIVAQNELAKQTDISFKFEEIKIGHGVGQIRFFIKSKIREKAQLAEAEMVQFVSVPEVFGLPEKEEIKTLIALLPEQYQNKISVTKLVKAYFDSHNLDYVMRNIIYTNEKSNAVKLGSNLLKGSNYRVYLSKALREDYGMAYKEDREAKSQVIEKETQKAMEANAKKAKEILRRKLEVEIQDRAQAYIASLAPEAKVSLEQEAIANMAENARTIVLKKGIGHKTMLNLAMESIATHRIEETKAQQPSLPL